MGNLGCQITLRIDQVYLRVTGAEGRLLNKVRGLFSEHLISWGILFLVYEFPADSSLPLSLFIVVFLAIDFDSLNWVRQIDEVSSGG